MKVTILAPGRGKKNPDTKAAVITTNCHKEIVCSDNFAFREQRKVILITTTSKKWKAGLDHKNKYKKNYWIILSPAEAVTAHQLSKERLNLKF